MNPALQVCPVCGAHSSFAPTARRSFRLFACSNCGVVIHEPFPSEEEMRENNREYYETVNPDEALSMARESLYEKMLQLLEKNVSGRRGKLLDVGCGAGHFLKLAAERGWETRGVEISAKLRDWARRHFHLKGIEENLDSFAREKGSFDAALFLDMLDETTVPNEFVQKAERLLKPGAAILIRVRNGAFQIRLLRVFVALEFLWSRWAQKAPYVIRPLNFTATSLKRILQQNGFIDVKVKNSPLTRGDPYGVFAPAFLSQMFKFGIAAIAKAAQWGSGGKWILGPSLLAVGRKP